MLRGHGGRVSVLLLARFRTLMAANTTPPTTWTSTTITARQISAVVTLESDSWCGPESGMTLVVEDVH